MHVHSYMYMDTWRQFWEFPMPWNNANHPVQQLTLCPPGCSCRQTWAQVPMRSMDLVESHGHCCLHGIPK